MKHISVIIAENREEALRIGKTYEQRCEHCGYPIWTRDEKEMIKDHLVSVTFRGNQKESILCNSCLGDIVDTLNKRRRL